jgi:hypothetical protein
MAKQPKPELVKAPPPEGEPPPAPDGLEGPPAPPPEGEPPPPLAPRKTVATTTIDTRARRYHAGEEIPRSDPDRAACLAAGIAEEL